MNLKAVETFLNTLDSRYRGVLVVAKRAKQLQKGLRTLFEGKSVKVTTLALEDFVSGKIVVDLNADPESELPPEPEEELIPVAFARESLDFPEVIADPPEEDDDEGDDTDAEDPVEED